MQRCAANPLGCFSSSQQVDQTAPQTTCPFVPRLSDDSTGENRINESILDGFFQKAPLSSSSIFLKLKIKLLIAELVCIRLERSCMCTELYNCIFGLKGGGLLSSTSYIPIAYPVICTHTHTQHKCFI